jgi:transcriptional regulator with GAF, ATPase, and Fis domain
VSVVDWTSRNERARRWLIWGSLVVVAIIQAATWIVGEGFSSPSAVAVRTVASWILLLALAVAASRRIESLTDRLSAKERAHQATLDEIEQLQTHNAMLEIVARSVDVPATFQALALRIARLVPCDRVGLALLTQSGQEFETSTARVHEDERRARPRPDVVFKVDGTAIGQAVQALEPLLIGNLKHGSTDYIDANVLYTAGFKSALVVPLISNGRGVGTLNVVARKENAFAPEHIEALRPIAEILAVAHVAEQLHMRIGQYRTIETMADLTLSIAAEINSALQTIIGHCALVERGFPDPTLQRDLATISRQAQRISELLDKMRTATNERLKEVADTMEETGIPTSPEAYEHN